MVDLITVVGILGGVVLGLVGGLGTALVTSLYVEPKSIRRDRKLRHVDSLLTEAYGPIQYALRRALARGAALTQQASAPTLYYVFQQAEAATLFKTFEAKWSLLSEEVQNAWLGLVSQDVYTHLDQLSAGELHGVLEIPQNTLAELATAIQNEIDNLRRIYEKSSGIRLAANPPHPHS